MLSRMISFLQSATRHMAKNSARNALAIFWYEAHDRGVVAMTLLAFAGFFFAAVAGVDGNTSNRPDNRMSHQSGTSDRGAGGRRY